MVEISKIITLAIIIGGMYLAYWFLLRPKEKQEKPVTTQDLIGKKTIVHENGIIETGDTYRACVHVSQINMRTNADIEKYQVWIAFRNFLNEINIPYTLLQLSQYIDVKEYADWYQQKTENAELTPELKENAQEVLKFIRGLDEDKNSRDYSGYVIFQYNPDIDMQEAGVSVGSPQVDDLLKKISGKKIISKQEKRDLATQILTQACLVAMAFAEQAGMTCTRLNRAQVYNLSYKILQKDYSAFTSVDKANEAQCFTPFHESITKRVVQAEAERSA